MIGLIILLLVVAVLVWLSVTYIPAPFGWILAAVVIILALVAIFGSPDSSTVHCC